VVEECAQVRDMQFFLQFCSEGLQLTLRPLLAQFAPQVLRRVQSPLKSPFPFR
jgi:hypothetical protein